MFLSVFGLCVYMQFVNVAHTHHSYIPLQRISYQFYAVILVLLFLIDALTFISCVYASVSTNHLIGYA